MKVSKKRPVHPAHLALAVVALGALLACGTEAAPGDGATASDGGRLRLATTTSLYDTGLWDILERRFEDMYNVELDILTGGTGKALEFGRLGEVDALAIHDRVREEAFIAEGYGVERHPIAYNHFLIVGPCNVSDAAAVDRLDGNDGYAQSRQWRGLPCSDPAGISGMSPDDALSEIMRRGQGSGDRVWFVSRGDESGTHAREKLLWEEAGYNYDEVRDSGDWYLESGAGMGAVLLLANEKEAYTLSDAGTYLAFQKDLDLNVLVEEGDSLLNVYSVIAVSPERFPEANTAHGREPHPIPSLPRRRRTSSPLTASASTAGPSSLRLAVRSRNETPACPFASHSRAGGSPYPLPGFPFPETFALLRRISCRRLTSPSFP